ncbi:Protein of unknown function [Poseidonocella pacifica]|uniref:DUF3572 domain-containing protein n=1 Tax=Poseidonocella pacifica TaxID=871651 RepID=A0A1I0V3W8_9RHOB|nr:DUF3572 domain-containing protein [Poseidonocella pacifica]SFA70780.1 Protein of unknown function [Poseidonocella pacifica]
MQTTQESAELVAALALEWISSQKDLLEVFLGSTGLDLETLIARASEAEILVGVLDFIMLNEEWVVGFCNAASLPYSRVQEARAALPGGEQVHWT